METVITTSITKEELQSLQEHLNSTNSLTLELGEIEMVKIQLEKRHENAKKTLDSLTERESILNKDLNDKYGAISLNYETGEYTKID